MRAGAFLRYSAARLRAANEERSFRVYVTDTAWLAASNMRPADRWLEIIEPPKAKDIDPEQIVGSVIERAGLKVI